MTVTSASSPTTPIFTITSSKMSLSHRCTITDAKTCTALYTLRKEGMGTSHYYKIEPSDGGPRLFEVNEHLRAFHQARTTVTLANQAAPEQGRPVVVVDLEFVPARKGEEGRVSLDGKTVCVIEKIGVRISGEYHVAIAGGCDPTLVVGLVVMMVDRARTREVVMMVDRARTRAGLAGAAGGVAAG
ncbi:hypothetical protein EK21DRAFT_89854 [Setomelanomma holmii]|uniref:Uncharacterized protein n=1 Tax=Setomelanomma holmii TaxID=210430 RepID=A0A9P4H915_9PLEO|nr:hypothetical protein EK21DRAFT_89854 [Setomelanomma holmii]